MQRSTINSFSADVNVYMRLFSHGDVSYLFNGKNNNVVLELSMFIVYRNFRCQKTIYLFKKKSNTKTFVHINIYVQKFKIYLLYITYMYWVKSAMRDRLGY